MTGNIFRLSFNMLRRDWRAGEWRVLLLALVLAVGSMSTVGLFADRVRQALQQEATSLLGADLRVTSTRVIPSEYRAAALQRNLAVVSSAVFPSMVSRARAISLVQATSADAQTILAEIMAVEQGYPLRGKIEIDDGTLHEAASIPRRGTVWVDARLIQRLNLEIGDEINLGALRLRVAARIVRDVDQAIGFVSFAPRVLLNAEDLPSSGLVQEGSRISYRLLIAGEPDKVNELRSWLAGRLQLSEKIEDVRDARPEIRTALERAENFLGLAALTAAVLASVALALAARQFITRHLDTCAMLRCLGASQAQVLQIFLYQFLLLGFFAVIFGCIIGYAVQAGLVQTVAAMRDANLPSPGWMPIWQASISGLALLLGFAFLPLWQLKSVSPLRVIRRELGIPEVRTGLLYGLGGVVLGGLFVWQAGSLKLGFIVLGGLAGGLLIFGLLAWLALRALSKIPLAGNRALTNLAQHGRTNALQIVALSLGGMALLLLTFVRGDLLENWRTRLSPDVPNRFLVNIQADQREPLLNFFAAQKINTPKLFPMVRGRLIAINQRTISGNDYPEPRARSLVEREFNLSWSEDMPGGNELVQGRWWKQPTESALSVEEGIANTLGIHIGDTLTYDVAGSQFSAEVVNLRRLHWDSMQVNFFVITTPALLESFTASYLTSFHLPADQVRAGDKLVANFPNLLMINTEAVIEQIRNIVEQIAQTVSAIFMFTLLSGLAVLYAALLTMQDERIHQTAILRTLGADSHYLRKLHLTEFVVLGALSGLFSVAGAALLGWIIAYQVLDIPYRPGAMLLLTGVGGGAVIVTLAGWLATRRVAGMSPLRVLQSS